MLNTTSKQWIRLSLAPMLLLIVFSSAAHSEPKKETPPQVKVPADGPPNRPVDPDNGPRYGSSPKSNYTTDAEIKGNADKICASLQQEKEKALRKAAPICAAIEVPDPGECGKQFNNCQSASYSSSSSTKNSPCQKSSEQEKLDFADEQFKSTKTDKEKAQTDLESKQKEIQELIEKNRKEEQSLTDGLTKDNDDATKFAQDYQDQMDNLTDAEKKDVDDLNKAIADQQHQIKELKTAEATKQEKAYKDAVNKVEEGCADEGRNAAAARKALRDQQSGSGTLLLSGFAGLASSTSASNLDKDNKLYKQFYKYCLSRRKTRDDLASNEKNRQATEEAQIVVVAAADTKLNDLLNKMGQTLASAAKKKNSNAQKLDDFRIRIQKDMISKQNQLVQAHNSYTQKLELLNTQLQALQANQAQIAAEFEGFKQERQQYIKKGMKPGSTRAYDQFTKNQDIVNQAQEYVDAENDAANAAGCNGKGESTLPTPKNPEEGKGKGTGPGA